MKLKNILIGLGIGFGVGYIVIPLILLFIGFFSTIASWDVELLLMGFEFFSFEVISRISILFGIIGAIIGRLVE